MVHGLRGDLYTFTSLFHAGLQLHIIDLTKACNRLASASYLWEGGPVCILSRWCTFPCHGEGRAGVSPHHSAADSASHGCMFRCKRRTLAPPTERMLGSSRSPAPSPVGSQRGPGGTWTAPSGHTAHTARRSPNTRTVPIQMSPRDKRSETCLPLNNEPKLQNEKVTYWAQCFASDNP